MEPQCDGVCSTQRRRVWGSCLERGTGRYNRTRFHFGESGFHIPTRTFFSFLPRGAARAPQEPGRSASPTFAPQPAIQLAAAPTKTLQVSRSTALGKSQVDTLNATKDRDSHYTRCNVYSNVSTDSQEQSPACKRRTWCYTVARSFRQYGFMAFVF